MLAMELKAMLEANGWRVVGPAARVSQALELLEREPPTAALLDVNLAGELVTRLAQELRTARVPFALASAYDRPERGDILIGVPNAGKPTTERRLMAALDEVLKASWE